MEYNADKNRIGNLVEELRRKSGYTKNLMATKMQLAGCDISSVTLSKIESGTRRISSQEAKALGEIFGVDYHHVSGKIGIVLFDKEYKRI